MRLQPIRTEQEHEAALEEIERLFENEPESGTTEGDHLEILIALVQTYEDQRYPLPLPDPIAAIRYHLESRGLGEEDLVPYVGSPRQVVEVLGRRQPLSLEMIRRLHEALGISADILIQPYGVQQAA